MLTMRTFDLDEMFRRFERDVSDLFGRTFGAWPQTQGRLVPPVEVLRGGDELTIRVELPGVDPDEVELSVEGDVLSIKAERPVHEPEEGVEYLRRELARGTFERDVVLPEGTDADGISAHYQNGILEIRAPYHGPTARKIPVEIGSGERKALTATAA